MKTKNMLRLLPVLALAVSAVFAKPIAGPKGGKILTTEAPHAEFFVEQDRTVTVTFYDAALKPLAPSGQAVTAIAEAKSGKVKLEFAEKNGALVSKQKMPDGDDYTVVVQIRDTATAKPTNYRVLFHAETCKECKLAEYACVCDDAGKEHAQKK